MTLKRRAGSIGKLANTFKIMDTDRSGKLDPSEFEACLQKIGLFMSKAEAQALIKYFDKDGDKQITCNEFLNVLKEPLNDRRRNMVARCFQVMDKDGSEVITKEDIQDIQTACEHPDVIAGKKTEEQILIEFLQNFEGTDGNHDGKVTTDEFLGQYEELSMGIPNDDYFVEMLASTQMILENEVLSDGDKATIKSCLMRMKAGILQKIPPTMDLENGVRNIFRQ